MKFIIETQNCENYGAHDWDGVGEVPQYWKNKGGDTYIIPNITVDQAMSETFMESMMADFRRCFLQDNESFQSHIIGLELLDDCEEDPKHWRLSYLYWEGTDEWVVKTRCWDIYEESVEKLERYRECGGDRVSYLMRYLDRRSGKVERHYYRAPDREAA